VYSDLHLIPISIALGGAFGVVGGLLMSVLTPAVAGFTSIAGAEIIDITKYFMDKAA